MNEDLMQEMLSKKNWAVIGATSRKDKIGYKIVRRLIDHGYNVYPVNPNCEEIDGMKCYNSIEELPVVPDCIDFVIPPKVTKATIEELDPEKIGYLWFQPGTYNEDVVNTALGKGFNVVHEGACVMIAVEGINEK